MFEVFILFFFFVCVCAFFSWDGKGRVVAKEGKKEATEQFLQIMLPMGTRGTDFLT